MSTQKVFEFAKEIGIETIALMDKIREWQLPVKSHMATLNDEMIEQIKTRLDEENKSSASKKKTTRKKVAKKAESSTKKTVAKKASAKKTATKKASATKVATATKATTTGTTKKTTRKKAGSVIRRKAGEVEAKAQEAMERAQEEAVQETPTAAVSASGAQDNLSDNLAASSGSENFESSSEVQAKEEVRIDRKPTNIVGRMDLGRVAKHCSEIGRAHV